MLRYGIPEFRLPRGILDREIGAILALGIELRSGVRVGKDVSFEALLAEHDAVILAAGCYRSIGLGLPGETLDGAYSGLGFMMSVCAGRPPAVGRRVLVVGAGFTAFDCARSALRLGAEDITLCLRRTEGDLRVTRDELFETKREGIRIQGLVAAHRILGVSRVEGVVFTRTRLGDADASGRRGVIPIEDSLLTLEAETLIVAVGQEPEPLLWGHAGAVEGDPRTLRSNVSGLYVAGDYLTGPSTVIEAVAAGRAAARRVAGDLLGRSARERFVQMEEAPLTDRQRSWDYLPRQEMPTVVPVAERLAPPQREVETGYSRDQALMESQRCYLCYLHYEIDISRCIYCRYCVDVAPRDCIKLVKAVETDDAGAVSRFVETDHWRDVNAVVIDNGRCIRCGECVRVCPMDCISITRVQLLEGSGEMGHAARK